MISLFTLFMNLCDITMTGHDIPALEESQRGSLRGVRHRDSL